MTVKVQDQETKLKQNLDARNKEVEKAFHRIIKGTTSLLRVFDSKKYRTCIQVEHSKSSKETKLINEFICFFWNLTLTMNIAGYKMIYFCYDEEALTRFGSRTYNRVLRQVFKQTMFENSKINIEDCVRINNPSNVQSFFYNRLANGENDFVSITLEEQATILISAD
jgi:hypothetical protein